VQRQRQGTTLDGRRKPVCITTMRFQVEHSEKCIHVSRVSLWIVVTLNAQCADSNHLQMSATGGLHLLIMLLLAYPTLSDL